MSFPLTVLIFCSISFCSVWFCVPCFSRLQISIFSLSLSSAVYYCQCYMYCLSLSLTVFPTAPFYLCVSFSASISIFLSLQHSSGCVFLCVSNSHSMAFRVSSCLLLSCSICLTHTHSSSSLLLHPKENAEQLLLLFARVSICRRSAQET